MSKLLLLSSMLVFSSYILYIVWKYKVQPSISKTYYKLPINSRWVFTAVLFGFSLPVMIYASTPLMVGAGGLICLVGVASNFLQDRIIKVFHMAGAYGGVVLGLLSLAFEYGAGDFALFIALFFVGIKFISKENFIWWIEIAAFVGIIVGLGVFK